MVPYGEVLPREDLLLGGVLGLDASQIQGIHRVETSGRCRDGLHERNVRIQVLQLDPGRLDQEAVVCPQIARRGDAHFMRAFDHVLLLHSGVVQPGYRHFELCSGHRAIGLVQQLNLDVGGIAGIDGCRGYVNPQAVDLGIVGEPGDDAPPEIGVDLGRAPAHGAGEPPSPG